MNSSNSLFASLVAVAILSAIGWLGGRGLTPLFGIIIPYAAVAIFFVGVVGRIAGWAKVPVPFCIPTTSGQGKSLPWIKQNRLDCPFTTAEVIGRMLLEVLLFRSLFKNNKAELREGPKVTFASTKWLWLFGILFHYSFLIIVLRHLRFFLEPIPFAVDMLASVDGFFQILLPTLFISDLMFLAGVSYLFVRRVVLPQMRYISLPADYFPLLLIFGIACSGILMRLVWKVDLLSVKQLTMGLVTFHPSIEIAKNIHPIFYIHLFLVCILIAYLPFSKIMHAGGVFLSPTRNMPSNNRAVRHENPWNYPVKVHTYQEYEDEFRGKMKEAGIPVDKE